MYALGQTEIMPFPTPTQTEAGDFDWDVVFQTETTGSPTLATPIITSQSPPPPPYPVLSPSYSQPIYSPVPLPVTLAALAIGGLLLFFLIRGVTR